MTENEVSIVMKALEDASRIASDRAAGGRMLTSREEASAVFAKIQTAIGVMNTIPTDAAISEQ